MKTKLTNLISETITGEWGFENINYTNVNIIRSANFNNDGSIDYSKLVERAILKKTKEDGIVKWIVDNEKIESKKLLDDDIIIEKSGGGPQTPVGRIVYFNNPDNKVYLCNNFTQIIRVDKSKIYPKYFFYGLQHLYDTGRILKYQNQTTGLINLKLERYLQEEIEVPNFDIQLKISTQLQILQELIDNRKESILILDKLLQSTFFEMFGNPISNPKKWKTKKLDELGTWKCGGTPKTSEPSFYNGNIPWFTSGELGNIFIEKSTKNLSILGVEKSNAKIIPINSIMIGMYDTAAFKMSINKKECTCNQAIIYSTLKDNFYLNTIYFSLLYSKNYYLDKRKGARQKNLSSSFIRNINVIYPNSKEGQIKVEKFNYFSNSIYLQKQKLQQALELLEKLFQSVLHNSFNENIEINEIPIFNELIKGFTIDDLKGNNDRLQNLINLFNDDKLNETVSYNDARNKLFELMDDGFISQKFSNDQIELQIK